MTKVLAEIESRPKRYLPRWTLKWIERYRSVKFTNQVLFIFLLISLVYLGLDFMIVKKKLVSGVATTRVAATNRDAVAAGLVPAPLKPYSYYSKEIENRELFNSLGIREPESNGGMPNLEENLANLNLIGIVSGTNSQAIIEEKKINKTYFLNKGDYIEQFKLEEILPGKVILTYNGQSWELNL